MGDHLIETVRSFLQRQGLLDSEALLLVAVSGGPDSLSLLHLLHRLRAEGGPRLHLAHLDHGLRPESPTEAAQVNATAAAWGIPATVERREVRTRPGGPGPMAEARRVRYAFLAETALAIGASAVAVAHQAEDQAETVLMHLLRGAGPAGLRGMRAVVPWAEWSGIESAALSIEQRGSPASSTPNAQSPTLIRPLLTATRAEILAYCAEQGLAPTDDPSNRAPRYARSRMRRLLAAMTAEQPRAVEAIGRAAQLCADDYAFIQERLDAIWPELTTTAPRSVRLRRAPWETLHVALQRYALRRAAALLGAPELSLPQVEAARALAARPGRQMRLGPVRLSVDQAGLTLARPGAAIHDDAPQLALAELALPVPGSVPLGGGWRCEVGTEPPDAPAPWHVALDPATLDGPLSLRRRRPGDRFWPAGGRGSRKLQDFFVDRKLPRPLRDAWPILATPTAVVWVPGMRADSRFLATPQTQGTIWVALVRDDLAQTTDDLETERSHPRLSSAAQARPTGGPSSLAARVKAMHHDIAKILISAEQIQTRVRELGAQISAAYADEDDLLLVGVLKGCAMFMVDLARSIERPLAIDFIAIASYGASTESSGVVRVLKDLDTDIAGRNVLIVEDIIDSGLTLDYLRSQLLRRNPASLRICTLLNKPERRTSDVPVDYIGFDIPNEFVVGYGLDFAEHYRNLPYIGVLKPEIYSE